jgi:hypothetical protein
VGQLFIFACEIEKKVVPLHFGIGQTNRVLLNMANDYNTRLLASDIKSYFEESPEALEVLIFKGKKTISIDRFIAFHPSFYRVLKKKYEK